MAGALVVLQTTELTITLFAHVALVRFLSGVSAHVSFYKLPDVLKLS
jgi:hypothetical protein